MTTIPNLGKVGQNVDYDAEVNDVRHPILGCLFFTLDIVFNMNISSFQWV